MDRKIWIYAGLLVVIVALVGVGIWAVLTPDNPVKIPDTEPLVVMEINNPEEGTLSQLSIYPDGTVIHVQDSAVTMPLMTGDEFTRTWSTGKVRTLEIDSFFSYLESVDFNNLEESYVADGVSQEEADSGTLDYMIISARKGDIDNQVTLFGYGKSYADLRRPVNNIYDDLVEIFESRTKEAQVEKLTK